METPQVSIAKPPVTRIEKTDPAEEEGKLRKGDSRLRVHLRHPWHPQKRNPTKLQDQV